MVEPDTSISAVVATTSTDDAPGALSGGQMAGTNGTRLEVATGSKPREVV